MTTNLELNQPDDIKACDTCGETNMDLLTYGPDPYLEDVWNEIVMVSLCTRCRQDRCDDI